MMIKLIDLGVARPSAPGDIAGLNAHLAPLIGEPFRFARVSYGDELTLHFGDLREARSPKLKKKLYGAYIVGMRGSDWTIKAGKAPSVISAGIRNGEAAHDALKSISKEQLESNPTIETASRVVAAESFADSPVNGFGLFIGFSDGSVLYILPSPEDDAEPEDNSLPPLADWELASPQGLLNAGPGLAWEYRPSTEPLARDS